MPGLTHDIALARVVYDDSSMRDALESLLNSVGLDFQTYRTASDFMAARIRNRPGCAVIDIRLPDMNGLDGISEITTKVHRSAAMWGMGARTLAGLIEWPTSSSLSSCDVGNSIMCASHGVGQAAAAPRNP
jgi:FixJ family two-component response regulator